MAPADRTIEQIQADIQANGPVPDEQGDAVRAEIARAAAPKQAVLVIEIDDADHLIGIASALMGYIGLWRKDPDLSRITGMHMATKEKAEQVLTIIRAPETGEEARG